MGLKLVKENEAFHEQAEIFYDWNSSNGQVISAGEKAMIILQKGKVNDNLETMRYRRFQELVTTRKKAIHPNMLPPTSAATKYHSLKVYHKVQEWQGNTLRLEDWGWKLSEGRFKPVISDSSPAPGTLLELVRCTCKAGCGTLRCGCRRQGLECSSACSGCRGICANMANNDMENDAESDKEV